MKKIILLFVLSLCINSFIIAQTWRKPFDISVLPTTGGCMVDQNTFWLIGSSTPQLKHGIYKSTDGGNTWIVKYSVEASSLLTYDITFVNSSTGFAGLTKGQILKTTDGGETWQTLVIDTNYANTAIYFFDAYLGYSLAISGTNGIIYKTTNGGVSWANTATLTGSNMYSMDFSSPTHGIAVGTANGLYYTTDGTTWNKGTPPTFPPITYSKTDQRSVKFLSPTTAVSCGWGSISVGYEPTIFLKTTDAGATWSYLDQADQNRVYVNFYSQYYKDSSNGIAIGGSAYPGTVICRTTDGGTNFVPLPTVSGFIPKVVIGSGNRVIVSGDEGSILISTDFGDSWVNVNKHTYSTLSSINIVNNNIYACGTSGTFYKSTDLGNTFNMSYMVAGNKCLWSKALQFINENVGYAVSQKGQVLKTTDAGNSWTQSIRDSANSFIDNSALYFMNESIGFVVGNYGSNVDIIYKTTDGGQSWSSVQNLAYQNLYCISFADDMHGAAGGNKSAILFTTDQGVSWNPATVNLVDQLAIKAIKFYDGLNGIAVGTYVFLKTTDGGATWNPLNYSTSTTMNSLCYSGSTFHTVGNKYCLKSTDIGNTWQNIMDSVFISQNRVTLLNSIAIDKSGFLWTVGNGCVIMTNSPVSGISIDVIAPNSFSLEQNYPNPFNPSTMISFTNIQRGFVTLKLFDILGREVRVIYKGEMVAGTHKINFNAGSLASGTYIYSFQVNDQFTCRKLTLLK
jgi:photosystem II stability/assembly factor-like uncharacterized protein